MRAHTRPSRGNLPSPLVWIGVGLGGAIGVAVALTRRTRDRWCAAKQVSRRVADRTGDLAAASKDIVERLKIIYTESRKILEEATEIWSRGAEVGRGVGLLVPGVSRSKWGRTQAGALPKRLVKSQISAIYSSPLERALETAAPLASPAGRCAS